MSFERDFLLLKVFPRIKEWCVKRGLIFHPVDLRWGITEEEAKNIAIDFIGKDRVSEINSNGLVENGNIVIDAYSKADVDTKISEIADVPENILTYDSQDLTEEQKMQARKNLGLYGKSEKPLSLTDSIEALSSVSTEVVNFSPENTINVRITQMDMLLAEYTFEQNEQYDYGSDITYRWYGNGYLMNNSFTDTGDGIVIYQKN